MRFVSASNPLTISATRRRATLSLLAAAVMALSPTVWAATSDEAVVDLQQAWELINYRTPAAEREKKFEALADRAHKVSEAFAGKPEPMVREGFYINFVDPSSVGLVQRCIQIACGFSERRILTQDQMWASNELIFANCNLQRILVFM